MRIITGLCGAALLSTAPLHAATIFSEDFSGTAPGTYGDAVPGSQVRVTTGNVDVVGVLNGSFFSCTDNPADNCLDLVGNSGIGGIASVPTFTLTAGDTYTVTFGAVLQGYDPGQGFTSFTVGLGSLSQLQSVTGSAQQFSVSFTPTVGETNAALSFTTVVPGDEVHGAIIDNIRLTDAAAPVSGTPEPASWAMLLAGFGAVGGVLRRRATTVSVAA